MISKGIGPRKKDGNQPEKRKGKNYLLAIAIDAYEHAPRLYNCVRDAGRMIKVLTHKYQFEEEHTFTLFNEAATEANILEEFKKLVALIRPEDNLLVIYSGHGEYEEDIDEGYWLPVDAQYGQSGDYISNSRITKYIKAIPAHHTLFIVDSCFSGSLFASRGQYNPQAVSRLDRIASRWLITAGRNEVVSDGKPGDHSPFADNIIYFLENNTEPSLSVARLIEHVIDAVTYNARQTPRGEPLQDVGHRGGQFFFYQKGALPPAPPYAAKDQPASPPPAPTPGGLPKKWGIPLALSAIVLMLITAIWFIARRGGDNPVRESQRIERQLLMQARTTYDSLFALGRQAFRQEQFVEAKGYFEDAIGIAAGFEIEAESAQKALDACNERLAAQSSPEPPAPEQSPTRPRGDQPAREEPAQSREEIAWQRAQAAGEEDAYRRYLQAFPEGKYASEARRAIANLYNYRPTYPFSMGSDKVLKLTLREGVPPFQVRINDPATERTIEKTFDQRGNYEISLSPFQNEGVGSRMVSLQVMDGNFKTFRSGIPF